VTIEKSYLAEEAVAAGLLVVHDTARVYSGVRIVPNEDNGQHWGPVTIAAGALVREGTILCSGVAVGENAVVGHGVVLRRSVQIGRDSVISHNTTIEREVLIGRNCRVSALTHLTVACLLEDDVEIGARVVTINDNELKWRRADQVLKPPIFRYGCRVGSGVTVLSGIEIGARTLVGAGAVVTRSLPPNVVAYGVPAYVQRELEEGE
jgi:acetyltransferase-like isoleucine patch superfamily enzyme